MLSLFKLAVLFSLPVELWAHGLHHTSLREDDPLPTTELSQAIAAKRSFPFDAGLCRETYDAHEGVCFVEFTRSLISHHDYTIPVIPVTLPNGDRVRADANERGFWIYYFGDLPTKEEQLAQISRAIQVWSGNGSKEITVQLFRPSTPVPVQIHPFKETKLGDLVGVRRKIPIRYSECAAKFNTDQCWVRVIEESVPDHPGPSGGGDISKEYKFSNDERVLISLENLYSDYLIYYEGPETAKDKILAKIQTAISKLKGSAKDLYLECTMFTLNRNKPLPNDKVISKATFFSVEMPLTYEICKNSLDEENQNCRGDFGGEPPTDAIDHPGGGEIVFQDIAGEGSFDIFSTYAAGDPAWLLYYERKSATTMGIQDFLKHGFEILTSAGKNKIHGYGFHTD